MLSLLLKISPNFEICQLYIDKILQNLSNNGNVKKDLLKTFKDTYCQILIRPQPLKRKAPAIRQAPAIRRVDLSRRRQIFEAVEEDN
eukprot:Pgem_evm2s3097